MRNKIKLIGIKIKIITIICVIIVFIFLLIEIFESIDDFISWVENLYYVKILLLGLAFIKGKDLWQAKVNKLEVGSDIIYKPKVWDKVLNIFAGLAIVINLILDIDKNENSKISYNLNLFLIIVFVLLPITFYIFNVIKNRSNYVLFNKSEIYIKAQNNVQKFKYVDIKSVNKTNLIELLLKDGSKYTLNNSFYMGYQDDLLALMNRNLTGVENNEINTLNQSNCLNESFECKSNNYLLCLDYPEMTFDAVIFALNKEQKIISDEYFIFYNNLFSPEYSIENMGGRTINGSDESIKIELLKLPSSCTSIKIFAVKDLNGNGEGNLYFDANIQIKIYDSNDNNRIIDYNIPVYLDKCNSIELLAFCKKNNIWEINPSGKYTEQDLQALVDIYC